MENSNIAWTHHTQNFWLGCDKIAPECAHCYIDRTLRKMGREWGSVSGSFDVEEPGQMGSRRSQQTMLLPRLY